MVTCGDAEAGDEVPKNGEKEGFPLKGCGEGAIERDEWGTDDNGAVFVVELSPPR